MVGDRRHDIEAARTLGITSIGVAWGFGTIDELMAAMKDDNPAGYDYAKRHRVVIEKYGRFPHRRQISSMKRIQASQHLK